MSPGRNDAARLASLRAWLERKDAIKAGAIGGMAFDIDGTIEIWRTPRGRMFFVVLFDRGAWDVFTAFPGVGIDATFADATGRLGIKS